MLANILIATASILLAPEATEAIDTPEENAWEIEYTRASMDYRGSKSKDYTYNAVRVSTTDLTTPEITVSCSPERGLAVTLFLRPRSETPSTSKRVRYTLVKRTVRIAGEKNGTAMPFIWVRTKQVLQSKKHKTAARIYNAIVRNQTFTVGDTFFDPPPVNAAFKEFSKTCDKT